MRNYGNKIPSQKESEEGMKRCPKTMSGKHMWTETRFKKLAWATDPFMDVIMCILCGLIDDRPTKKGKP